MQPQYYDTETLAERLGVKPQTLRKWRMQGKGPDFHEFEGIIRYSADAVRTYEESNCRKAS